MLDFLRRLLNLQRAPAYYYVVHEHQGALHVTAIEHVLAHVRKALILCLTAETILDVLVSQELQEAVRTRSAIKLRQLPRVPGQDPSLSSDYLLDRCEVVVMPVAYKTSGLQLLTGRAFWKALHLRVSVPVVYRSHVSGVMHSGETQKEMNTHRRATCVFDVHVIPSILSWATNGRWWRACAGAHSSGQAIVFRSTQPRV